MHAQCYCEISHMHLIWNSFREFPALWSGLMGISLIANHDSHTPDWVSRRPPGCRVGPVSPAITAVPPQSARLHRVPRGPVSETSARTIPVHHEKHRAQLLSQPQSAYYDCLSRLHLLVHSKMMPFYLVWLISIDSAKCLNIYVGRNVLQKWSPPFGMSNINRFNERFEDLIAKRSSSNCFILWW